MDQVVDVPVGDAGLELGLAVSICFSCGLEATRGVQIWFEDIYRGTFSGFRTRRSYELPVCERCSALGRARWPKILGWGGLSLLGLALPFFLAPRLGFMTTYEAENHPVLFAIGFVLSLVPILFTIEHWRLKDQGGGFVQFVAASPDSVQLRLADASVAARVRELLAG